VSDERPAWGAYLDALRELHIEVGRPSMRAIARVAAQPVSHQTVNEMLNGKRLPSLSHMQTVVKVLDHKSIERMTELWMAAAAEQDRWPTGGEPPTTVLGELVAIHELLAELLEVIRKEKT
jgi:hypothetical protein